MSRKRQTPVKATKRRARVLIADDHRIVALGVARLLSDHCDVLGVFADGESLLAAAVQLEPDLVVVDISMPGGGGLAAIRELRHRRLPSKAIVLTMHHDRQLADEARIAGASAYLLKDIAGEELLTAVDVVLRGEVYFPSPTPERRPVRGARADAKLTPRQRDVLRLIARGMRAKEIGAELQMSPRTVETHKYEMMETLGLASLADLVRYAIRLGLVDD